MNRVIYVNEIKRLFKIMTKITEGGLSRNYALMQWIEHNVRDLDEINLGSNRIINIIRTLKVLLIKKDEKIIFQYTAVGIPLHSEKLLGRICSSIFLNAIRFSTNFNELIFDVSDLKYEQSIDLEINKERIHIIEIFEKKFFNLQAKFIFASDAMRQYACNKYSIGYDRTDVCINGGNRILKKYEINKFEEFSNDRKLLFVYAGTLNKGRQIESMIREFPSNNKVRLLLLGSDGDWLEEYIQNRNIYYFGAVEEEKAHYIVSQCDIGLIPYDDSRLYYNLAYPTKLSFYITAGIPFLSTPMKEIENIQKKYSFGYIATLQDWSNIIKKLSETDIKSKKELIKSSMNDFIWDNIFDKNKFI